MFVLQKLPMFLICFSPFILLATSNDLPLSPNTGKGKLPINTTQASDHVTAPYRKFATPVTNPFITNQAAQGHKILFSFVDRNGVEWGVFQSPDGRRWVVNDEGQTAVLGNAEPIPAASPTFRSDQASSSYAMNEKNAIQDASKLNWNQTPSTEISLPNITDLPTFRDSTGQTWAVTSSGQFILVDPTKK